VIIISLVIGLLNCIVKIPKADTEYASIVGSIVFGK
jgi:hypothetical protein